MPRQRQRACRDVLPDLPPPPPPHNPRPIFDDLNFIPVEATNRENRAINAMQWFKDVVYHIRGSRPLVVRQNSGLYNGSYVVSIALQERALRDPNPGDTVIFHVQSGAFQQEYVAARDAVRKALEQMQIHTGHVIPDYSFLKMKALELNEPAVTQVPKRISPPYESVYDTLNCGFLHTEFGLLDLLRQILPPLGYSFVRPYSSRVQGGFQSSVTLTSAQDPLTIYGETLDAPYKAKDSALIYTLDYVDMYLGINILDANYTIYLARFHNVDP